MPTGVYERTEYHKNIASSCQKKRFLTETIWNKGIHTGFKPWLGKKRPDIVEKLRKSRLGKKLSEETKKKISEKSKGSNHWNWQGGLSKEIDYHKERNKEWINKNREYKYFLNLKRRALKLNAEGSHTFEEWEALKKQYGYICLCCKKKKPLTEDHIIPLIKGGSDYIENIQPLCKNCNCKKHTKTIKYEK